MTDVNEIYENIAELLNNVDDVETLEEVKEEYEPFQDNMKALLKCDCIESYLEKYEKMCEEDSAVLTCYEIDNVQSLKEFIQEDEISFEELKTETVRASCDALELIIFDVEADY